MQLSHMKIKYFRCFDNLEINFQTRKPAKEDPSPMDALTVLVGRNGDGKTAILDAINIAWNPFFRRIPVSKKNGFKKSDRPSRPYETVGGSYESGMPRIEAFFETELPFRYQTVLDIPEMKNVVSKREAYFNNSKFRTRSDGDLVEVGDFLMGRHYDREEVIWPLFAYYGDNRLWNDSRISEQDKEAMKGVNGEYAYFESTNPKSGFKEFTFWFVELSRALANKKEIWSETETEFDFFKILDRNIQDSLSEVLKLTGWTKIICDDNGRIIAYNGKNVPIEVTNLSAGTRIVLGMVADIVLRCCKLNRYLRENVLKKTPGIVLIDEIELHLHPEWQQEILPTLCKIFPRIQFIVTTHSPQVVSSVPAECIRILDGGEVLSPCIATEGARAEQILNDVFGTDSRAKNDVSEKLSEYRGLINDGKWDSEEALQLKRFLHERLGSDPYLTRLEIEVRLKENQRRRANETH